MTRPITVFLACVPLISFAFLDTARADAPSVAVAAHGDELLFALDYRPASGHAPKRQVVVALDTSRSMAGEPFDHARASLVALGRALEGRGIDPRMVHGDLRTSRCPGSGTRALTGCIDRIEPGGATNLQALLERAVDEAGRVGGPVSILLLSDGRVALGARTRAALDKGIAARIGGRDIAIHTAVLGDDPDHELLADLARHHAGSYTEDIDAQALASALEAPMITDVDMRVVHGDVRDLAGNRVDNLDRAIGYSLAGKLISARARVRVRGTYRGQSIDQVIDIDPTTAARDPEVVERWARVAIRALEAEDPVDQERIEYIEEHYLPPPEPEPEPGPVGTMTSRRVVAPPVVVISCGGHHAAGHRDKHMIRRAVRARLPMIRHCYTERLRRDRRLAGQVSTFFSVAPDGSVEAARISQSTLGSADVEACVLREIRALSFVSLAHSNERVDIHYPFDFQPPPEVQERTTLGHWANAVAEHVAAGRIDQARRYIARREREIADNDLGQDALLPLLASDEARAAFAPEFLRAARARLARPVVPMGTVRDLFGHFLRIDHDRDDLTAMFQHVDVDTATGIQLLSELARSGPAHDPNQGVGHAERLARAWWQRRGAAEVYPMVGIEAPADGSDAVAPRLLLPGLVWDTAYAMVQAGDTSNHVMDALFRAAHALGKESRLVAPVLDRCKTLDQGGACTEWLVALSTHAPVRARLRTLYTPVVSQYHADRRASPEYNFADLDMARALAFTGNMRAAVRALSETVEQDPDDPDQFRAFASGLMSLQQYDEACAQLDAYTNAHPYLSLDQEIEAAYHDAWGVAAPAGLCGHEPADSTGSASRAP